MSENEDNDRLLLKNARKERKRQKKFEKRLQREKELENKKLQIRLGPTDSRIKIVSRELALSIHSSNPTTNRDPKCDLSIISQNNFPTIEQSKNNRINRHANTECYTREVLQKNESKKLSCKPVEVQVMDILTKPIIPKQIKLKKSVKIYSGNILDSNQPVRKQGKYREVPKRKVPSKLKTQIVTDQEIFNRAQDSSNNQSSNVGLYRDNELTKELDDSIGELLSKIVAFQENLYKSNPVKGAAKRRYVAGFHEVKKLLVVKKVEVLIIVPDLKNFVPDGSLHLLVQELVELAGGNNIPYIFALSRRKLGRLTLKFLPVSCVGILKCSGAEEALKNVLKALEVARDMYQNSHPQPKKDCDTVTEEIIENFVNLL